MLYFKYDGKNELNISYQTLDSAGFDVCSDESVKIEPGEFKAISTGIFLDRDAKKARENKIRVKKIQHYFCEVRPRSGLTLKGLVVHLGTIDPDYKGEIKVIAENRSSEEMKIEIGMRIAQIVILEFFKAFNVDVKTIERGQNGFGSTGI